MKVYVTYETYLEHSHRSSEEYGEWREYKTFYVLGVQLAVPDYRVYYDEFQLGEMTVNTGDTLYVLWMKYSTGDSFGCTSGNGEILWVFADYETARAALERWEVALDKEEHTVQFTDSLGNTITLANPCSGYFENLEHISIQPFVVDDKEGY